MAVVVAVAPDSRTLRVKFPSLRSASARARGGTVSYLGSAVHADMSPAVTSDPGLPPCFGAIQVENLFEFPHESRADEPSAFLFLDHSSTFENMQDPVEAPNADAPCLSPLLPRLDGPSLVFGIPYGSPEFLSKCHVASRLPEQSFEELVELYAYLATS